MAARLPMLSLYTVFDRGARQGIAKGCSLASLNRVAANAGVLATDQMTNLDQNYHE